MIPGNPTCLCPGPCYGCGNVTASKGLYCDNCLKDPLPERPHPLRCPSCKQWECEPGCIEPALQLASV